MNNNRTLLLCLAAAFFTAKSHAQTITELSTLKAPANAITVDASIKEWGDSLRYYSMDAGVHYAFTNDKDNLYFAIKLDDPGEVMRALKSGITIGVNPKGKSKPSNSITFPANIQSATSTGKPAVPPNGAVTQADRDDLHRQLATNMRGIKVEGFKDIEGDMITTSNTYGFKTAMDYDADGNLILEAAIPMKFLSVDAKSKNEWTFDVKINGLTNPPKPDGDRPAVQSSFGGMNGGGGGRGGMGGGGGRGGRGGRGGTGGQNGAVTLDDKTGLSKAVEFEGKFSLAPVQ